MSNNDVCFTYQSTLPHAPTAQNNDLVFSHFCRQQSKKFRHATSVCIIRLSAAMLQKDKRMLERQYQVGDTKKTR